MNGLQILVALVGVIVVLLVMRSRRRHKSSAPQVEQDTPLKGAKKQLSLPPAFEFKKKKPFEVPANPLNQVTVQDPMTGMKASSHSRLSALAKLEGMAGRKINNPQFRKK